MLSKSRLPRRRRRWVQRVLEPPMRRLHVPVLVRPARGVRRTAKSVVLQQLSIAPRQPASPALGQLVGGRRQIVRAMLRRHPAQAPQRLLQSLRERLERLGVAQLHRLPVRVRQHEVVRQVRKRHSRNAYPQRAKVGEVRLALLARMVTLRKVHLARRSTQRPPIPEPALKRAQLTRLKATRVATPELLEHRLRLQPCVGLEQLLHLRPYRLERVLSGAPCVRHACLARQPPQPTVLARRALAHPRLRRRRHQRQPLLQHPHQ